MVAVPFQHLLGRGATTIFDTQKKRGVSDEWSGTPLFLAQTRRVPALFVDGLSYKDNVSSEIDQDIPDTMGTSL